MLQALQYKQRILDAVPVGNKFEPLMTCYLTDNTSPDEVHKAKEEGIIAYKLYPAGATTNSSSGVTDFQKVLPTLNAMAKVNLQEMSSQSLTSPGMTCICTRIISPGASKEINAIILVAQNTQSVYG